jgi:hypothetical protein
VVFFLTYQSGLCRIRDPLNRVIAAVSTKLLNVDG